MPEPQLSTGRFYVVRYRDEDGDIITHAGHSEKISDLIDGFEALEIPIGTLPVSIFETDELKDGAVLGDATSDIAVFWWAQIASDVATGKATLPPLIRANLDDAALFAALDATEQMAFERILDERSREEAEAGIERTRECA